MDADQKKLCLACQRSNLCFGYIGTSSNTFVPAGIFSVTGFRTRSYVCLDCGHVGQFLMEDKIKKLREKLKNRYV